MRNRQWDSKTTEHIQESCNITCIRSIHIAQKRNSSFSREAINCSPQRLITEDALGDREGKTKEQREWEDAAGEELLESKGFCYTCQMKHDVPNELKLSGLP